MQSLRPRGASLQSPVSVDRKFSESEAWMGLAFPSPCLSDGEHPRNVRMYKVRVHWSFTTEEAG